MKTVKVECNYCGKEVEKPRGEYNRRVRLGKNKFYCNNSCGSKEKKNLDRLRLCSKYDISQHCQNRKDDSSCFRWYIKSMSIENRSSKRARSKELSVDLEYLKLLWISQGGFCPFSNISMILKTHTYRKNDQANPYTASLDRIDNSIGYEKGNIRFVCLMANYARNRFSDEQVIEFCKKVASFKEAATE